MCMLLMDLLRRTLLSAVSFSRLKCMNQTIRRFSITRLGLYKWEPDGLVTEPDIPPYPGVLVKLQGYDYTILETYAKYVNRIAGIMRVETNMWPLPAQKLEMQTLQANSTKIQSTCNLNVYQRVVELQNIDSTKLPIFLDNIWSHIPEGVKVTVAESTDEEQEARYVPDHAKQQLIDALGELPSKKK
ncbi:39S ribosomal protein L48, mitochondrial-like isoform X2 [Dreissena polymorpha]|uniref:39S ribosomal protein L48, mitochondrial-like isoform X2 n=1 Tax=Dreissena polymorpha TaxID=45954 RepID=UPI0022645370|nr:39S ribosomal protein L48, mitochondrial-like isoform X2 [Dreissena polymorpha]